MARSCPSGFDVRVAEVIALEQQQGLIGACAGIGETIAHVQRGGVASSTKARIRLGRQIQFALAYADKLERKRFEKQTDARPSHRNRKCVAAAEARGRLHTDIAEQSRR